MHSVAGVDEDESMYMFQDKDILECEFYVIEALQFDLILHHPFPSLLQYDGHLHELAFSLDFVLVLIYYSLCAGSWTNLKFTRSVFSSHGENLLRFSWLK